MALAAASEADTAPTVSMRSWRNRRRSAAPVIHPSETAPSADPEWAWLPEGNRASDTSASAASGPGRSALPP